MGAESADYFALLRSRFLGDVLNGSPLRRRVAPPVEHLESGYGITTHLTLHTGSVYSRTVELRARRWFRPANMPHPGSQTEQLKIS